MAETIVLIITLGVHTRLLASGPFLDRDRELSVSGDPPTLLMAHQAGEGNQRGELKVEMGTLISIAGGTAIPVKDAHLFTNILIDFGLDCSVHFEAATNYFHFYYSFTKCFSLTFESLLSANV